jgi:hypothetical protein
MTPPEASARDPRARQARRWPTPAANRPQRPLPGGGAGPARPGRAADHDLLAQDGGQVHHAAAVIKDPAAACNVGMYRIRFSPAHRPCTGRSTGRPPTGARRASGMDVAVALGLDPITPTGWRLPKHIDGWMLAGFCAAAGGARAPRTVDWRCRRAEIVIEGTSPRRAGGQAVRRPHRLLHRSSRSRCCTLRSHAPRRHHPLSIIVGVPPRGRVAGRPPAHVPARDPLTMPRWSTTTCPSRARSTTSRSSLSEKAFSAARKVMHDLGHRLLRPRASWSGRLGRRADTAVMWQAGARSTRPATWCCTARSATSTTPHQAFIGGKIGISTAKWGERGLVEAGRP